MNNKNNLESVLKKAGQAPVKKLSDTQKNQVLEQVFLKAKLGRRGFARAEAFASLLTARFGPLALRFIIATLAIVLLAGGGYVIMPAPVAMGSEASHTVEIAKTSNFQIAFDTRMDKSSVEKNFSIAPPVPGSFTWNDNAVTFTPSSVLEKGITYSVTVSTGAQNILGKNLTVPYRAYFVVKNDPEVSVVAPVADTEIASSQRLTVLFDRPIRELTGSLQVPNILDINPKTEGSYVWLGTSGFEFIPTNGWKPATDFTVTVPQGFTFADGAKLEVPFTWRYRTPDITIQLTGNLENHRTKEPLSFTANAPIRIDAFMAALSIKENGQPLNVASAFTVKPASGTASTITFTPKGTFKLGSSYTVEIPAGFTGGVGTRGMPQAYSQSFQMDEAGFKLNQACPAQAEEKDIWDSVALVFNNPVDEALIEKHFTITPALQNQNIYTQGWSDDERCHAEYDRTISLTGTWKPSTEYTVTIASGLKDIYGQTLGQNQKFTFKTKAHQSSVELNSYSTTGILASHLPRMYQARVRNLTRPLTVELKDEKGSVITKKDFDTTANLNTYKVIDIDLDAVAGKRLANGKYSLLFTVPDLPNTYNKTIARDIMIADTALTAKVDNAGKVLIWATDMQTGYPVPGLKVQAQGKSMSGTGSTNQEGIAIINLDPEKFKTEGKYSLTVLATSGTHYGYLGQGWSDGISPWNYGLSPSYGNHLNGFVGTMYTDRKIYRPDQKVYWKGIVRQDNDATYSIPEFKEIKVMIENASGQRIHEQTYPVSRYGSFQGEFDLSAASSLGEYRIWVAPSGTNNWDDRITGTFTVSEFRRPDFKVTVTPPSAPVIQGDTLMIPIKGEYYSGAPLGNAKVTYVVTRRSQYFQPLPGEWFNYTDDQNSDCYWYCSSEDDFETIISGTRNLNAAGEFTLQVPVTLGDFKGSANYNIEVTVEDSNNRTVSNRVEFPIARGEFALGVRPNYEAGWSASSLNFDIVTVSNQGKLIGGIPGTAKLYQRVWSNIRKETVDGSTSWDSTPTDTLVTESNFVTAVNGRTKISFSPQADGEYFVVVSARDNRGNTLSARATQYLYRGGSATMRVTDDHMLKIIQNKADYQVGDTASLVIQTPYTETKALLTIERETIREYRVINLSPNQNTVQIPITGDSVPNLYVSVMTVKGGESGIPEYRLGYADLRVDTTSKQLTMTIKSDKQTYKPGETVTLSVETNNKSGKPEQAEVSIAVVDERIVALMGSVEKNILGTFYFRRSIGVDTYQTLTQLIKRVFITAGDGAGDGKGGGDSAVPIRGNFQDTAYWKADVETGTSGKAQISFKLPENLTNWQVLAIANTTSTLVGTAETTISTRQDLAVEPLLPRFLRYGDAAKLGASVENGTDTGRTVQVTLKAPGLTVTDGETRSIYVAPRSRIGVTWNVQVPYTTKVSQITVTGTAGSLSDGYTVPLKVLPFSVPEIVTTAGFLEKSITETLEIPKDILENQGEITVSVAPNIGEGITSGVEYLLNNEYDATEYLGSSLLATSIFQELTKQNLVTATTEAREEANAKAIANIQRLLGFQKPNGGFGYWSSSANASPHLTAYVLWSLHQARVAGHAVDQGSMDRAAEYLKAYLASSRNADVYEYLGPSEKAQVLFVLSEMKQANLSGYANGLYEQRNTLSVFAKGFLAMTYINLNGANAKQAQTLLAEMENSLVYLDPTTAYIHENDGYGYFMSSDVRSSAIMLMVYNRVAPNSENTDRIVRFLMSQKTGGYWETTQSTSYALLSLVEYAKRAPVDTTKVDVTIFLNSAVSQVLTLANGDRSKAESVSYAIRDLITGGRVKQFGLQKQSDKRYFYDISMKVFREIQDIQPFDNGFTVISEYYAASDEKFTRPITQAKPGETVRVRLKVIAPKRRELVAIEHHLPAGLEAVDVSLNTANRSGDQSSNNQSCYGSYDIYGSNYCWAHVEFRDDRVFLGADKLDAGVYEYEFFAQAVTPGEYRVPPARAYEMYRPQANGHNQGKIFRVIN